MLDIVVMFIAYMAGLIGVSLALNCFQCGTEMEKAKCEDFQHVRSWKVYEVKCPKDHYCAKVIPSVDTDRASLRGCSPSKTMSGRVHETGCSEPDDEYGTVFCFCDSDYCNGVPRLYDDRRQQLVVTSAVIVALWRWWRYPL